MSRIGKIGDAVLVAVALASVGFWGGNKVRTLGSGATQPGSAEAIDYVTSTLCGASGGWCSASNYCFFFPGNGHICNGGQQQGKCCTNG